MGARIATFSVAISVFTMILAVAIVRGFRMEIENRAVGFMEIYLLRLRCGLCYRDCSHYYRFIVPARIGCIPEVSHVQEFATSYGMIRTDQAIQSVSYKGVCPSYVWDFLTNTW